MNQLKITILWSFGEFVHNVLATLPHIAYTHGLFLLSGFGKEVIQHKLNEASYNFGLDVKHHFISNAFFSSLEFLLRSFKLELSPLLQIGSRNTMDGTLIIKKFPRRLPIYDSVSSFCEKKILL